MTSPPFGEWIWRKTRWASHTSEVDDVFVSKAEIDGESDLVVIYTIEDGTKFAVLIEDKINAPF